MSVANVFKSLNIQVFIQEHSYLKITYKLTIHVQLLFNSKTRLM